MIRSGGLATLAGDLEAAVLHEEIAYLTSDEPVDTPYAERFEILESFGYREAALRRWVRDHEIGILEIKTRGLGLDPAPLRRRLKLRGSRSATVVAHPHPRRRRPLSSSSRLP